MNKIFLDPKLIVIASTISIFASCKDIGGNNDGGIIPPMTEPHKEVDVEPDWSPDGKAIAYTHEGQIWILDLETMQQRFLTVGFLPDWSPSGQQIAFVRDNDIHVIDTLTKQVSRLTTWGSCFFPSWSPDGSKIAFDTDYGDPNGASAIWIMNSDGSSKQDISQHGTGEWREPRWSPTGQSILHVRYIGISTTELFIMDTAGNNPIRLTSNTYNDWDPAWSSDGSKIAWSLWGEGLNNPVTGIWIMNADGNNQHLLVNNGAHPTWSPDGNRIAFHKPDISGRFVVLWLINTDGSNLQQLTYRSMPQEVPSNDGR